MNEVHIAAQRGHVRALEQMAARGVRLDYPNADRWTPLHFAVLASHIETVTFLIRADISVNTVTTQGHSPLHFAAQAGDAYILALLVESGAKLDAQDFRGQTPLHYAVAAGSDMCVKFLLGFNADPNILDHDGYGPLHVAANQKNYEISVLLLDALAQADLIAIPGSVSSDSTFRFPKRGIFWSPVHLAAKQGLPDILKILFTHRADPNVLNSGKVTPLHVAAAEKSVATVQLLISAGADVLATDADQEPPLFCAVRAGLLENVKLCCNPSTITMSSAKGETALHLAAQYGHGDLVAYLIQEGANQHVVDSAGNSALHQAVVHKRKDCVLLLLEAGSDVMLRNNEHQSPFSLATGPLILVMKQHLDRNPDCIQSFAVEKFARSSRAPPSALRRRMSSAAASRATSGSPSRLGRRTARSEVGESSLLATKAPQPVVDTLEWAQEGITAELGKTESSLLESIESVRDVIEALRRELSDQI
jgi:ankyrin repeat/protein kinase domain-containing protein 1